MTTDLLTYFSICLHEYLPTSLLCLPFYSSISCLPPYLPITLLVYSVCGLVTNVPVFVLACFPTYLLTFQGSVKFPSLIKNKLRQKYPGSSPGPYMIIYKLYTMTSLRGPKTPFSKPDCQPSGLKVEIDIGVIKYICTRWIGG